MEPQIGGNGWGSSVLICPECGAGWLHHTRIEVFNRTKEDSAHGLHVTINGMDEPCIDTKTETRDGNPSLRRNGIRIHLWCETCGGISVLELAQHKGCTFLDINVVAFENQDDDADALNPMLCWIRL